MTKEEKKEYKKEWFNRNREQNLEKKREYYRKKKEEDPNFSSKKYKRTIELHPNYNKNRMKKLIESNPYFYKDHYDKYKEKQSIRHKEEYKTIQGRSNSIARKYKNADVKKGFDTSNNITKQWIIDNIFNSSCIYCGDSDWTHLGADRIDNSKPHTPDNCVCACGLCNIEKSDKYTVEEFKEYRKTHPREIEKYNQKSWEIVEMKGIKVLKKRAI